MDEAKIREDALKAQVMAFEKENNALKEQKKSVSGAPPSCETPCANGMDIVPFPMVHLWSLPQMPFWL